MTEHPILRPEAEEDLAVAFDWYEAQQPGLGEEFVAEIERVISRIAVLPLAGPVVHKDVRRLLPKRFPYAVLYVVSEDQVRIALTEQHSKSFCIVAVIVRERPLPRAIALDLHLG